MVRAARDRDEGKQMKVSRVLPLALVLCFILLFVGCSDNGLSSLPELTIHRVPGSHIAAPGEELTINGENFGATVGDIYLIQRDLHILCAIVKWENRAIIMEVPEGIEGICDLLISCPAGEKVIASYVHVKKNPEVEDYVGKSCAENRPAGLAYYNGDIWLFQSVWNGSGQYNDVQYQTYDIANNTWSNCSSLKIGGSIQKTAGGFSDEYAKVTPVVVNNWLLAFWFNDNRDVMYGMYTGKDQEGLDMWQSVPGTRPDVQGSNYFIAPVYNPTTNRLELYYTSEGTIVCFYADVPDPQKPFQLTFQQAHPTTPLPESKYGPGAAIVQTGIDSQTGDPTYQTMLACADSDKKIHINYLDGNYNSIRSNVLDEKTNDTPCLVNLENGLVALLWEGTSHYGDVIYYNWQNQNQGDHGWTDKESWKTWLSFLTAVAAYDPISPGTGQDPDYPDMKGQMYCVYNCFDKKTHWRIDRDLGLWRYKSTTPADMTEGLLNPDGTPGPTFSVCPVLAVVDAPPFALNGETVEENKTYFMLAKADGTGSGFDVDLKAGPYVEAGGEKKPFTMQVSAGATYANKREFHQTMTVTNSLNAADPAQILLVMLAPVLNFTDYERYDTDNKPTGDTFTMVTLQNAYLHFQPWSMEQEDFDENFPDLYRHKAGCVNTYDQVIGKSLIYTSGHDDWHYAQQEDGIKVKLTTEDMTMSKVGGYANFKIGLNIKKLFSLGVEGEFQMNWSNTTSVSTETELNLWNPEPKSDGDVIQFDVTAYWLNPKEDADWVPAYRQGSGDKPWFITYNVASPVYQGGIVTPGCE